MVKRMLGMLVLICGFGLVLIGEANAKPSDLLTSAQLNAILTSAKTPADYLALQEHFSALADKFDAEASAHAAEAQANWNNLNPGSHFPGSATLRAKRSDRLAELARSSAQEARGLATAYEQKTPADHLKLQAYYATLADTFEFDANRHAAEAQSYRDNWNPGSHFPGSAAKRAKHCDQLAESARKTAQEARERSSEHGQMAVAS